MKLSAKKLYIVMVALSAVALLVLFGAAYMANSFLKSKSEDVRKAVIETRALERQRGDLQSAGEDVKKYKELSEVAASIVPQDKDQTATVREIVNLAAANNIALASVTFPSSSLGGAGGVDAQLTTVPGLEGTYTLSINLANSSNDPTHYDDFIRFLQALEQNRRTALVRGFTLTPSSEDTSLVNFTLTLDEYIKP